MKLGHVHNDGKDRRVERKPVTCGMSGETGFGNEKILKHSDRGGDGLITT